MIASHPGFLPNLRAVAALTTSDDVSAENEEALKARLRTYLGTMFEASDGDVNSYTKATLKRKTLSALIANSYGQNTQVTWKTCNHWSSLQEVGN